MRDKELYPISVRMENGATLARDDVWKMEQIVGADQQSPFYEFEAQFTPFRHFSRNVVDKIDLVVSLNNKPSIPLEVKLTVVPDSSTMKKPESEWAPEIVIRPVSSAHAMMSLASNLTDPNFRSVRDQVIKVLQPAYNQISNWDNESEVIKHSQQIHDVLWQTLQFCEPLQSPFLLQPIWRTKGQSLELSDNCLDVFVWSDVATMGIPVQEHTNTDKMSRTFREIARHVRSLYDVLRTEDYDYSGIYKGMPHGNQTDKSFSISGSASLDYLAHHRLTHPIVPSTELNNIILNGGENHLKPERRFDSAVQANMISLRSQ